jgi:Zn-dependent peptidase ImmA (M78 family)
MSHHHHHLIKHQDQPAQGTALLPEITPAKPWIISRLRSMIPTRPLTFREAQIIAERQAAALLEAWGLTGTDDLRVPDEAITEIPRIDVQYRSGMEQSGSSTWDSGAWRITINADEWRCRQRFTLAHELKHVIDSPVEDLIYSALPNRTPAERQARSRHIEGLCDHFAACLLMPRVSVKRAWGNGLQKPVELARAFEVSEMAMSIRLQNLGLIPRPPRTSTALGRIAVQNAGQTSRHYHRALPKAAASMPVNEAEAPEASADLVLHSFVPSATMRHRSRVPALTSTGGQRWSLN